MTVRVMVGKITIKEESLGLSSFIFMLHMNGKHFFLSFLYGSMWVTKTDQLVLKADLR
jgi:flagellar biosynthesis protein FliR